MALFTKTSKAGKRWCRICGRPVQAAFGEVCSRPECHHRYLQRHGGGR